MSASNRALSRLPLSVFTDLIDEPQSISPEDLRHQVCKKLRDFHQKPGLQYKSGAGSKPKEIITSVGALLRLSPAALLRAVDPLLTHRQCQELVDRVCAVCAPRPQTALSLLQNESASHAQAADDHHRQHFFRRHLPSGMQPLDECLCGGFRVGAITEIVGKAGVGKTQLAMQLCVLAAKVGLGSVYIDTERKLSLRRMKEIAQERRAAALAEGGGVNHPANNGVGYGAFSYSTAPDEGCTRQAAGGVKNSVSIGDSGRISSSAGSRMNDMLEYKDSLQVLENVTVHSPASTKELLSLVSTIEDEVLIRNEEAGAANSSENARSNGSSGNSRHTPEKFPVGLIVLDSIAAPTRRDFGADSAVARVNAIFQMAQTLKRVADQLNVAVVVINQFSSIDAYGKGSAALGVSWHHCVSTRLLLDHEHDPHRVEMGAAAAADDVYLEQVGHVRSAHVVKNAFGPNAKMSFEVNVSGVSAISS